MAQGAGGEAENRSPKSCDAAEWLVLQNNSSWKRSDSDQQLLPRHRTNPISPPTNVTPDFHKDKENKYIFKTPDFQHRL